MCKRRRWRRVPLKFNVWLTVPPAVSLEQSFTGARMVGCTAAVSAHHSLTEDKQTQRAKCSRIVQHKLFISSVRSVCTNLPASMWLNHLPIGKGGNVHSLACFTLLVFRRGEREEGWGGAGSALSNARDHVCCERVRDSLPPGTRYSSGPWQRAPNLRQSNRGPVTHPSLYRHYK